MSSSSNLWVLLSLGIAGVLLATRRLKRAVKEDFGAFVERLQLLPPPQPLPPKAPHPLSSLSFAVSDMFDIEGHVTGLCDPDLARTGEPAARTAAAVAALVGSGATCVGKTVVADLASSVSSLSGESKHYGTPTNPAAPDRVPGGCSSGAAVAVAGGLLDFSLGVDTIGGVRIPGAFCGVLGFRSSHASVSNVGVIPISPSLDTTGWFSKDPSILRRVGHVLLQLPHGVPRHPRRIIIADDCFQISKFPMNRVTQVVIKSTEKLFGRQVLGHLNLGDYLRLKVSSVKEMQNGSANVDPKASSLEALANAMSVLHKHEFQHNQHEWIKAKHTSNLLEASHAHIDDSHSVRNETRVALNSLLKDDGILVLPAVLGPPPKLNAKELLSDEYQTRILCLTAVASVSGCCQVTIPLGIHEKTPVSVSFIARHGGDHFLLDTVNTMYASLQEQVDIAMKSNISRSSISKEESAEIAKEKGNAAYKEKQWQKAVNLYTEAIKLSGNNATYYCNRAAAYLEQRSFVQAEADCNAAIKIDKKNVKAYLRRGTAREVLGYYQEAMEDFRHALVLEPTNKTANLAIDRIKKFV
ncbi:outer envelope protein 64, chloroplastic [Iris pallida]|uniref:Outer envelope protein 64, chloroplastic n=1 Tax=Iris pallida TaxID=29817 RepID=A0AAX6F936_IRIPA|nr:outer envelope protein 64, chloroplastic [Iris pallida]